MVSLFSNFRKVRVIVGAIAFAVYLFFQVFGMLPTLGMAPSSASPGQICCLVGAFILRIVPIVIYIWLFRWSVNLSYLFILILLGICIASISLSFLLIVMSATHEYSRFLIDLRSYYLESTIDVWPCCVMILSGSNPKQGGNAGFIDNGVQNSVRK